VYTLIHAYRKTGRAMTSDKIITDIDFLRQKSRKTSLEEVQDLDFVNRAKAVIDTAWTHGYGLAAIQIGIPIRAAWYRFKDTETLLINTSIMHKSGAVHVPNEGCLSIPDTRLTTVRYNGLLIRDWGAGTHLDYTVAGLESVIIQHEVDHMDGILCIDRKVAPENKPGRNEPCFCGSGKKYKKCCIDK